MRYFLAIALSGVSTLGGCGRAAGSGAKDAAIDSTIDDCSDASVLLGLQVSTTHGANYFAPPSLVRVGRNDIVVTATHRHQEPAQSISWAQRMGATSGVAWAADVELSAPDAGVLVSQVTALPSGDPILIWDDNRAGALGLYAQRLRADTGAKMWATDALVLPSEESEGLLDLAATPLGVWLLVEANWWPSVSGFSDLELMFIGNDGAVSRGASAALGRTSGALYQKSKLVARGSDVWVAWEDEPDAAHAGPSQTPNVSFVQRFTTGGTAVWATPFRTRFPSGLAIDRSCAGRGGRRMARSTK